MTNFVIKNDYLFEIFYNSILNNYYPKTYIYSWFNKQHIKLKEYIDNSNIFINNNKIITIMIQLYNEQLKTKNKLKQMKSKHPFLRKTLKKIKLI